jgi:hypothetical protein
VFRSCSFVRRPTAEPILDLMGEIKVADVRAQVALSMHDDFENFLTFKPRPQQEARVTAMLDDLVAWGQALRTMRRAT